MSEDGPQSPAATRTRILELFPDKGDTYELILAPRFARLLAALPPPPSSCATQTQP